MNDAKDVVVGYAPAIVNTCNTGDSGFLADGGRFQDPDRPAVTVNEALVCQLLAYDIAHFPNRYSVKLGLSISYNAIVRRLHHVLSYETVRKIVASLVKKGVLNPPLVQNRAHGNHKLYLSFADTTIAKLAGKDLIYLSPDVAHKLDIKGAVLFRNLTHWHHKNAGKGEDFDGWIAQPTYRLSELTGMSVRTIQRTLADMEADGVVETMKMENGTTRIKLGRIGKLPDKHRASERKTRSEEMTVTE